MLADEPCVQPVEPRLRAWIDEQRVHLAHEAVAGLAVDGPRVGQSLVRREDLLDDDVRRAPARVRRRSPALRRRRPAAARNTARDRARPSGWSMRRQSALPCARNASARRCVAPNTSSRSARKRCKVVDVEEAAVVDVVGRDPPEREPVGLPADQRVEDIEAARIARIAVDGRHVLLDEARGVRHGGAQLPRVPLWQPHRASSRRAWLPAASARRRNGARRGGVHSRQRLGSGAGSRAARANIPRAVSAAGARSTTARARRFQARSAARSRRARAPRRIDRRGSAPAPCRRASSSAGAQSMSKYSA